MNLGGDVIFHQHQSYLNNNNIHFPNFDFPVYLNSDDEMTEHWYSSTPRKAISTGRNCNKNCILLSERIHLK